MGSMIEKTIIAERSTINIKLVPHRGCWVGNDCALDIFTSFPDSKLYTTRCSAPWYWNRRFTSFIIDMSNKYITKKVIRNPPDTILKAIASRSTSNNVVVIHMGAIINKLMANPIAKIVDRNSMIGLGFLSFSSGMVISADHCKVAIPIFIASKRPAIPLNIGLFQRLERSVIDLKLWRSTWILPSESRTAVA